MNNTVRYVFAGILIFLIILLQPTYLKWLGYGPDGNDFEAGSPVIISSIPETGVEENIDLRPRWLSRLRSYITGLTDEIEIELAQKNGIDSG